jgi:protein-L-isoaspartate(D-aspartate) O-methyltransferase
MTPSMHSAALAFALALLGLASHADGADRYASERTAMVREIAAEVRATSLYLDKRALDPRVLAAMGKVPRHALVPEAVRSQAYANRPLPIGYGQTISQPYIVAVMTDLLHPKATDRVLEIGTGSGYQAAILAEVVDQVYTMEVIPPLGERARAALQALGYGNITVKVSDGYYGWPEHAPFDAIVVTAAASHVPPPLLKQLKPGGRMVIPVGSGFMVQELVLVQKARDGRITTRQILPVRFVPLTGDHP